jgi:hypothetical protein
MRKKIYGSSEATGSADPDQGKTLYLSKIAKRNRFPFERNGTEKRTSQENELIETNKIKTEMNGSIVPAGTFPQNVRGEFE